MLGTDHGMWYKFVDFLSGKVQREEREESKEHAEKGHAKRGHVDCTQKWSCIQRDMASDFYRTHQIWAMTQRSKNVPRTLFILDGSRSESYRTGSKIRLGRIFCGWQRSMHVKYMHGSDPHSRYMHSSTPITENMTGSYSVHVNLCT
jgi:hypothetical protein